MRRVLVAGAVFAAIVVLMRSTFFSFPVSRDLATIVIKNIPVSVEIARTPAEHARGLMYREELADTAGMVFLFDTKESRVFWNQHTLIPLDVAWIASGRITGVSHLPSIRESGIVRVSSPGPVDAVIELPAGWIQRHEISVGDEASVDSLR